MKNILPNKKSERGQSLLEFAISLTILLMLLMGAVEFGLALFQFVAIRDAAQEAAVYGSIAPDDIAGIQWHAVDAASDILVLDPANVEVRINGKTLDLVVDGVDNCEGQANPPEQNFLEVIVTFEHPVTYPFVADMINDGVINLHGASTTTILQPTCPIAP